MSGGGVRHLPETIIDASEGFRPPPAYLMGGSPHKPTVDLPDRFRIL